MPFDPLTLVLRSTEAALSAGPMIVVGFVAAGVLRAMVPPAALRRLFGAGRPDGPIRAWFLGAFFPVGSLGVLPVLGELRRAGVSRAAILTFAIAAPLFNPFALLYGLTVVQPCVLAVFVLASMAVAIGAGSLGGGWADGRETTADDPAPAARSGVARLARAGSATALTASGPAARDVLVGFLGVGLLGASMPHGTLMYSMVYTNTLAPLTMAAIAPLAYVSSERAMMLVGEMYGHSSAPGAAFALLVLGAGLNLGTFAWAARAEGGRALARWSLGVIALTLLLGHAINASCYLPGSEDGHTHIFDNYSRPSGAMSLSRLASLLSEAARPTAVLALTAWGVLALVGIVLRVRPPQVAPDEQPAPPQSAGIWDRPLSTRGLVAATLPAAVGLAIAGAYVYFPSPDEMFEDIRIVRADAFSAVQSNAREAALSHVMQLERMTDRLPIGALLRRRPLDGPTRDATQALRESLGDLHDSLMRNRLEEARERMREVQAAHDRCRDVYLKTATPPTPGHVSG